MASYKYRAIIVHHAAQELSVSDGGAPEKVDGGYFQPIAVFNQLGADGWKHTGSVHEQIEGVGNFTMHYFCQE
jgi:hypothetical protein